MTTYQIKPEPQTLHGHFSRDLPPVLTIQSGDTVQFQTIDANWYQYDLQQAFEFPPPYLPPDPAERAGHALCGPVYVEGAQPGMTLEVRIKRLITGAWGWTAGGGASPINERLGIEQEPRFEQVWALDPKAGIGRNADGQRVELRPFLGLMGMPPDEPGDHLTRPPRYCGGNIDCKELVEGSTLYLPITVAGALFSTGDGHARQGDGEVAGPALECPMELAELEFHLRPDLHLTMPRAYTPAGWITFGFNEDLNEAWLQALDGMLDLIGEQYGYDRQRAMATASLVVDMHITQVVNATAGVHCILPDGALQGG